MLKKFPFRMSHLIVVLSLISIVFMVECGIRGRIYAPSRKVVRVHDPDQALRIWQENGVRGRILFTFDRHLHAETGEAPLSANNYIRYALRENIVRKIHHIVPDSAWDEVSRTLAQYPLVTSRGEYFRLFLDDGTPVLIMRIRDIGPVKEPVLLNINGDYWDRQQVSDIVNLLVQGALSCDVITLSGNNPDAAAQLIAYEKQN